MRKITVRFAETSTDELTETSTSKSSLTTEALKILEGIVHKGFKRGRGGSKESKVMKALTQFVKGLPEDELQALVDDKDSAMASVTIDTFIDLYSPNTALAFNHKQTATRMPKEKIAERLQKHQDAIKRRMDRIKVLKKKQGATEDKTRKMTMDRWIINHNSKISHHKDAIKYYKRLSSLKPVEKKENKISTTPKVTKTKNPKHPGV